MNILKSFQEVFTPSDTNNASVIEIYNEFHIKYTIQKPFNPENLNEKLIKICNNLPENDSWTLKFLIDNFEPIKLVSSTKDYLRFKEEIVTGINDVEEETITVDFHVYKITDQGIVNIYDFHAFCEFVRQLPTINFLNIIKNDIKNQNLYFSTIGEEVACFYTKNLKFGFCDQYHINENNSHQVNQSKENCYFENYVDYPFMPTYFNLIKRPLQSNSITEKLDKLTTIFCLSSIYDITSIADNRFNYKLNGYKTIQGSFDIDNTNISSTSTYMKIYDWIYLDSSNITDKIGLSRNILSIFLKDQDSIEIDESAYFSVQSGFKTYLQQNLNRYIDIRNKINDQLISITQKSNDVMEKYLGDFQKNVITFVSYFISVFLIKFLSPNNSGKLFNEDTTKVSLAFIAISLLYLLFSRWNLDQEKERLELRYKNLRNRFLDLLIEEDINKILCDDKDFLDELKFFNKRKDTYTFLWILTMMILLVVILTTSSYFENFF